MQDHRVPRPAEIPYTPVTLPSINASSIRPPSAAHAARHSIPHSPSSLTPSSTPTHIQTPSRTHAQSPGPYQAHKLDVSSEGSSQTGATDQSGHATPVDRQVQRPLPIVSHHAARPTVPPTHHLNGLMQHNGLERTNDALSSAPAPVPPHPAALTRHLSLGQVPELVPPQQFYGPPPNPYMADFVSTAQPMGDRSSYAVMHDAHPYQMVPYGAMFAPPAMHRELERPKKKSNRATQACEHCRSRKSKCDEVRPTCGNCKDQNIVCSWRDATTTKAVDKNLSPELNEILSSIPDHQQEVIARLERLEAHQQRSRDTERARRDTPTDGLGFKSETPAISEANRQDRRLSVFSQPGAGLQSITEHTLLTEPASKTEDDFEEHTTAAHKLLFSWPSINQLVKGHDAVLDYQDYMLHGEARGWLRVDGVGESRMPSDIMMGMGPSFDSGMVEDVAESPFLPELDPWSATTSFSGDVYRLSHEAKPPVTVRPDTFWRLFTLYEQNMHVLHPFLDLDAYKHCSSLFLREHGPHNVSGRTTSPAQTMNGMDPTSIRKRKRSDGVHPAVNESQSSGASHAPHMLPNEKPLMEAIMYLILAIGSIIEHQGPIPGPVPEESGQEVGLMQPPSQPYITSPGAAVRASPGSSYTSMASTPFTNDTRTACFSPQMTAQGAQGSPRGSISKKPRTNMDEMPGLHYYEKACRLFSVYQDSNEISVAHAQLLAGLYKGQLGRVQESWTWIHVACRVCRYQIRLYKLDEGDPIHFEWRYPLNTRNGKFQNVVLLTTWSALQLESDILAELNYPHSGITEMQGKLPFIRKWPGDLGIQEDELADLRTPMDFYELQVYLRRRLNEMHHHLYGKNLPSRKPTEMANILKSNEQALENIRLIHEWEDGEPPADTILEARVRAKFYGARYICLRPYLDYVLHGPHNGAAWSDKDVPKDARGNKRINEHKLFAAIATMPQDSVRERARRCVQSAIYSTRAFDHVPGRLVVTNIVGTAHAQFSNMLVLAAAHSAGPSYIRELISARELKSLFERTFRFLGQLKYCSPTAKQDLKILQVIFDRIHAGNSGPDYRGRLDSYFDDNEPGSQPYLGPTTS